MGKKFFIRSSMDLITQELEKLQNKVKLLEASTNNTTNGKRRKKKRSAVYSHPEELEAKTVSIEFEDDAEMFTTNKEE